jgi:hypothetical protein
MMYGTVGEIACELERELGLDEKFTVLVWSAIAEMCSYLRLQSAVYLKDVSPSPRGGVGAASESCADAQRSWTPADACASRSLCCCGSSAMPHLAVACSSVPLYLGGRSHAHGLCAASPALRDGSLRSLISARYA